MEAADRAVRATLAYYAALQWPLSPLEVAQRLVPPHRLGIRGTGALTIGQVVDALTTLAARKDVVRRDGLFGTPGLPERAYADRRERERVTEHKWRRMRRYAVWFQAVPYVRALLASGSLALGSAGPDSDWDMFVVVRAGRLYTARTFLLAAAWCMGKLRTKHHRVAPDRFCFNHTITTDALESDHRGIFTAHALAVLVPVHDPDGLTERLREANEWAGDFIAMPGPLPAVHRAVPRSHALGALRRIAELVLDTALGDALERVLRRWQQGRIAREPATHAPGGRIVASDQELEFHPRSLERAVLDRYNAALARMGFAQFAEPDSGLTT